MAGRCPLCKKKKREQKKGLIPQSWLGKTRALDLIFSQEACSLETSAAEVGLSGNSLEQALLVLQNALKSQGLPCPGKSSPLTGGKSSTKTSREHAWGGLAAVINNSKEYL